MEAESLNLPYRAEYAKSGRSSCKGCKEKIEKDHLRLAVMIQSPMFDGKIPNWYHLSCFFGKQRPKSVGDFSHFESIRWEDQEKIKQKIASSIEDIPSSSKNDKKSVKRKSKDSLKDFCIEYSISSRAICRGCEEKIIKKDIRVSKKDYDSEDGRRFGGVDLWHHLDCFVKLRVELEFYASASKLSGFKTLTKEDQIKVKETLPEIKPIKKEETEEGEKPEKKPKLENKELKEQNKQIFMYRDFLKTLSSNELMLLLEYNNQQMAVGIDNMSDRLADAMTFGSLTPCSECRNGQLTFCSGVGYKCLGNKDNWVKCEKIYTDPKRKSFRIPKELKDKYPFLQQYKYKPQKRVFQNITPSAKTVASSSIMKSVKSELHSGPKINRSLPLKNMEFAVIGKLKRSKDEIKLNIMRLGGKISSKVHDFTTAVICSQSTFEKMESNIKLAKELNIQIVPEDFIDECKNGGDAIININKMNLASWGSDPSSRIAVDVVDFKSKSHSGRFKSKLPTKMTLKVKDGVAVDPLSGLEDVAHVYREGEDIFNAALSLSDVQSGKNSFYKIQLLESNTAQSKNYWLFRSWGRIGTSIGGNKLDNLSKEKAIKKFKFYFEKETANMWDNRKHFCKVPNKMIMMDICYEDEKTLEKTESTIPSILEKPIQDLISLIFNTSVMKNVMLEFELDLEKMPLGKLSKTQIREAFKVLTKLQDCISESQGEIDNKLIISYTNQFFTLIPHDFGIGSPPLLNDLSMIKQKVDVLDTLLELEIAYSMLKNTSETGENHIDSYYMKLNAEIQLLDKISSEYKTLELFIKNTHAETHRNYELEIIEIFKIKRHGEERRFKPFKKLNRKLLWHGSRLTNFAGILSQGLRIAPPEAPTTGYMFGKGIYFADMVSKSANYCLTNPTNNIGLLLLCEVAVGESYELFNAENITKLPVGKHSVKGIGKTEPNPADSVVTEDGVEIPLGKGVPSIHENTSLLYNEYIVYDIAQVKARYLLQVKFNYTCF